jgi:hypothetical protein
MIIFALCPLSLHSLGDHLPPSLAVEAGHVGFDECGGNSHA